MKEVRHSVEQAYTLRLKDGLDAGKFRSYVDRLDSIHSLHQNGKLKLSSYEVVENKPTRRNDLRFLKA